MEQYYRFLVKYFNYGTPAGEKLYYSAVKWLGKDASPNDHAPDEYGCAETINNIVYNAFGDYAGGDLSTYRMFHSIKNNRKFVEVKKPLHGDIILSPTGYGNGKIKNGHVGIVAHSNKVMSNDSKNGMFLQNYTLESWTRRYKNDGGYPVYFYRRLFG